MSSISSQQAYRSRHSILYLFTRALSPPHKDAAVSRTLKAFYLCSCHTYVLASEIQRGVRIWNTCCATYPGNTGAHRVAKWSLTYVVTAIEKIASSAKPTCWTRVARMVSYNLRESIWKWRQPQQCAVLQFCGTSAVVIKLSPAESARYIPFNTSGPLLPAS